MTSWIVAFGSEKLVPQYLQLCGELSHINIILVNGSYFLDFVRKVVSLSSLQQQVLKLCVDGVPGLVKTSGDTVYYQVQDFEVLPPVVLLYRAATIGLPSPYSNRLDVFRLLGSDASSTPSPAGEVPASE